MTAKEILKGIKALFEDVPTPAPTPAPAPEPVAVEMKEYSLADGTKVMLDKLEVGGKVTINDAPAPMGEHILADGTKIELDAAGMITEISAPEPVELKTPEQMQQALAAFAEGATSPDMQKMATILKAVFENVFGWQLREAQEKAARDQAIALYQAGFEEQKKLKEGFAQMIDLVEKLTETPAAEPVEPQKNQFGQMAETKRERIEKVTKLLTQIKNK